MREERDRRSKRNALRSREVFSDRPHEKFRICPDCEEDALFLDVKVATCMSCGTRLSIRQLAMLYEGVAGKCPKCKYGYLGYVSHTPADGGGESICPACGFTTTTI
jgi:uncharacterized protein (DUF983 family)